MQLDESRHFQLKMGHLLLAAWLLLVAGWGSLRADYFGKQDFEPYDSSGPYPRWEVADINLNHRISLDAEGIPTVQYGSGRSYNPVTVALFGLSAFNRWKATGKVADREYFLKTARWLVTRQDVSTGCWFYDFDFPYVTLGETLRKPWASAMAQGLAMSSLARAHRLTGDKAFLEAAERALTPFEVGVEQGGVVRPFSLLPAPGPPSELVFYEEYPTRAVPSYTLNGFMFALLGLYDLSLVPNAEAARLFQRGEMTLRTILPFYDLADLSAYDLGHLTHPQRKINKSLSYHLVHIVLLNALNSVTHDPVLAWYRDRWNSYGTPLGPYIVLLETVGVWAIRGHPVALGSALFVILVVPVACLTIIRRIRSS